MFLHSLEYSIALQAAHIQQLQEKLSEVQQQLEKETRRSHLLEQELAHLRSLTLQHTKHQSSSSTATVAQQSLSELLAKQAASKQLDHELHPQLRPRAQSIDGKPSSSQSDSPDDIHRVCSAPAGPAMMMQRRASMDKAVSSALHAVSGAYLKEQAQLQSSSLAIRQQPMSEAESKARRFIEQAQPVLGEASNTVTISKQAFELLVLKDRAINAVKEGITIADCSLPDHPLIFANDAFSKITGYSREEALGKNCRQGCCPSVSCNVILQLSHHCNLPQLSTLACPHAKYSLPKKDVSKVFCHMFIGIPSLHLSCAVPAIGVLALCIKNLADLKAVDHTFLCCLKTYTAISDLSITNSHIHLSCSQEVDLEQPCLGSTSFSKIMSHT